jgi:zinc protease
MASEVMSLHLIGASPLSKPTKRLMHTRHFQLLSLFFCVIALSIACGRQNRFSLKSGAGASPTPDEAAVVNEIFAHYLEAIGGKEAIEGITSYKMKGVFEIAALQMRGTLEVLAKDPNKSLTVIQFPGFGPLRKGFDGETRWVQTPVGTFSQAGPQEMSEVERDAEVYRAGRIQNLYEKIRLDSRARLNGRDVYVIEGKPAKGPAEKLFFDVENGLLVRWDMARRQPNRTIFVRVHLNDYREIEGVKVPFNVRFAFESFDFSIKLDELQHNVPIDDAVFQQPK